MRCCLQCYMWGWDGMDSYHRSQVFFRRAPLVLITYLTLQSLPMWFHWNNRQYNGSSLLLQVSSMQLLGYCARNSTFGEQIFSAQSFLHQLSFLFQIPNCKLFFPGTVATPFLGANIPNVHTWAASPKVWVSIQVIVAIHWTTIQQHNNKGVSLQPLFTPRWSWSTIKLQ